MDAVSFELIVVFLSSVKAIISFRKTAKKIRERSTTRTLYKEVQELQEAIMYALKKNKELKKLILKNEEKSRDGFEKICFMKKFFNVR